MKNYTLCNEIGHEFKNLKQLQILVQPNRGFVAPNLNYQQLEVRFIR